MANVLSTIRNSILTSIHGRRIGLDANECLAGPKDIIRPFQVIGPSSALSTVSTTGTAILNYGITSLAVATQAATTGSSYGTAEVGGSYLLQAPIVGTEKIIFTATNHSTMLISVGCSTGVTIIATSAGSTFGGVSFNAPGQWVRLIALSTDHWLLAGICTGASVATT